MEVNAKKEDIICPNCKREIPADNFTVHSVHCARNIKLCPVCKEPVPLADLQDHHDRLHKMAPCKKCGESVCGTDLEDHIRDSCAHTIQSCRYCELELPRREVPPHEAYCGARTEQCAQCREWVMIRYRQLHLDSNHGFLRLDDDPVPLPSSNIPPKTPAPFNYTKPITPLKKVENESATSSTTRLNIAKVTPSASTAKNVNETQISGAHTSSDVGRNVADKAQNWRISNRNVGSEAQSSSNAVRNVISEAHNSRSDNRIVANEAQNLRNGGTNVVSEAQRPSNSSSNAAQNLSNGGRQVMNEVQSSSRQSLQKRNNDQPQINTAVDSLNKVVKDLPAARQSRGGGAVKKRPAPQPPARAPPAPEPRRDLAYYRALERRQHEERRRRDQNALNLALGLPPVLSPAEKVEKLRKMDALHNREYESQDYRNRLQGRVWGSPDHDIPVGNILGTNSPKTPQRRSPPSCTSTSDQSVSDSPNIDINEFRNLKPMNSEEFNRRFIRIQSGSGAEGSADCNGEVVVASDDRFNEIKTLLSKLRKGLNEVTAPYNSNAGAEPDLTTVDAPHRSRSPSPGEARGEPGLAGARLPCEFCGELVPALDLVQHETGCRPDLTQYRPRGKAEAAAGAAPAPPRDAPPASSRDASPDRPLIPCEFCERTLPAYLIAEHQEHCSSRNDFD